MIKKIYKRFVSEKSRIKFRYFIYRIRGIFYFGKTFYCNCCKNEFRTFLPKGHDLRPNAECPYCGSLERTRLLLIYLQNETNIFKEKIKVLHIAPENCLYKILKKLDLEYIDGDINPAKATHVIDITDIKYPDDYFDIIICSHVLGHIPNEDKAISELNRVLNINGSALILTVINPEIKETFHDDKIITSSDKLLYYGEPDLCRKHGLDFKKTLMKSGFLVDVIDYRIALDDKILKCYSLGDGKRELIFCCHKPNSL